jgi:hypothetical protein
MENSDNKPITTRFKLKGHSDSIIPEGIIEQLTIRIVDYHAYYHFNDVKITKAFVIKNNKDTPYMATYIERIQCARVFYPNWKKAEVFKKVMESMHKQYGVKQQ